MSRILLKSGKMAARWQHWSELQVQTSHILKYRDAYITTHNEFSTANLEQNIGGVLLNHKTNTLQGPAWLYQQFLSFLITFIKFI